MTTEELKEMRRVITDLIDDVKYHSDSLTDLERLPVVQLRVILAKLNKLSEKTVILMHYIEQESLGNKQSSSTPGSKELSPKSEPTPPIDDIESVVETTEVEQTVPASEGTEKPNLLATFGINEKYLFASTLFEGNMQLFLEFVGQLDQMEDTTGLAEVLNEQATKYAWDMDDQIILDFIEMVNRHLGN